MSDREVGRDGGQKENLRDWGREAWAIVLIQVKVMQIGLINNLLEAVGRGQTCKGGWEGKRAASSPAVSMTFLTPNTEYS